jgi:hypothetical protein
VTLRPALADVGTARFLADSDQPVRAHQGTGSVIDRVRGRLHPDPGRLALDRIVRSVRLLWMAQAMIDDEPGGHSGDMWRGQAGASRIASYVCGRWRPRPAEAHEALSGIPDQTVTAVWIVPHNSATLVGTRRDRHLQYRRRWPGTLPCCVRAAGAPSPRSEASATIEPDNGLLAVQCAGKALDRLFSHLDK